MTCMLQIKSDFGNRFECVPISTRVTPDFEALSSNNLNLLKLYSGFDSLLDKSKIMRYQQYITTAHYLHSVRNRSSKRMLWGKDSRRAVCAHYCVTSHERAMQLTL
jgi:hypothetical protein